MPMAGPSLWVCREDGIGAMKRYVSAMFRIAILTSMMLSYPATYPEAATYYVRTDGGTASQCTGKADLPYPGSGLQQACAWSHPFWALDGNSPPAWVIRPGDTLLIHPGSYRMGFGSPNTSSWCYAEGAFDCTLPPLPSGIDAEHPTRLLGVGWDQGCSDPPELWGAERSWQLINLNGTSDAVIGCLELTDHSGCVEFHADSQAACKRDSYPFGDWASAGIYAADSARVRLTNLNIHGFTGAGIRAGRLTDWTVENVRIAGNGWVGWEGDLGGPSSNSGTLTFRGWTVEWNGCAESYPDEQPGHCWAQPAGGYGDGVGTAFTGGHWVIEDSIFRYNTSDGLDLLYAREAGSDIKIRRTMAYGNAGNQIKTTGPTLMENVLAVSNCGYFQYKPFAPDIDGSASIDHCRAGGSSLAFSLKRDDSVSIVNSTIAGQGDCLMTVECAEENSQCSGLEQVIIKNDIFQGYADFLQPGDQTCYLWADQNTCQIDWDYNVVYDVKIGDGLEPLGAHDILGNPLFQNDDLEHFDGHLTRGSPAVDTGLPVGDLDGRVPDLDLAGNPRPSGGAVDRGAYEFSKPSADASIRVTTGNFDSDPADEFAIAVIQPDSTAKIFFFDDNGYSMGTAATGVVREISLASGNFDDDAEDEIVLACVQGDGSLAAILFDADGARLNKATGGQCSDVSVTAGSFDEDLYDDYVIALLQVDGTLGAISFRHDGSRLGKGVGGVCSKPKVAAGNFDNSPNDDEYVISLLQKDGTMAAITFQGEGGRIGKGVGGECTNVGVASGRFFETDPLDGYALSLIRPDQTPAVIFFKAAGQRVGKGTAPEKGVAAAISCGDMAFSDGMDEAILAYLNESGEIRWEVFDERGLEILTNP